ncbi:OmpA family protein [Kaistella yonginensis]|uniref:OmpA family protein n=1 Tax=Kaistella yonginensis TaxID=658267 RepID=UPI0025B3B014|nr:OmpA family protein [Kaistella yonginensis]MDN3606164.1 OmpA family protein [Kaistella yonginensis]
MKNLKVILASAFLATNFLGILKAQETPIQKLEDKHSYWQISARAGYDFPMYKETFRFIDYKGGFMGGLSVNKYWNWFGVEADVDFINNTPEAVDLPGQYVERTLQNTILDYASFKIQKKEISRTFVGAGPAFKWQTENNKFTSELGLMGGVGFIDGGEILVDGVRQNALNDVITYHSGFDKEVVFSTKAQLRFNYFFNDNWGLNAGAYYMNHYNVAESTKNEILDKTYGTKPATYYYVERGKIDNVYDDKIIMRSDIAGVNEPNQMQKMTLQSVGVFAGLSYRFGPKNPAKVVETKAPEVKSYRLVVTAKDKFSGQVIPNTQVLIKDLQGNIIKTAMTDASGKVYIDEINPNNYAITGSFNEISLDPTSTKTAEFIANGDLNKELIYADRNFILKGRTFQCNSSVPLSGAAVYLENKFDAYKKSTMSDANGDFILQLPPNATFELYAKKENYFSQIEMVNTQNYNRDRNLFVNIEICAQETKCGEGIALDNILYNLDKYNIREDAKPELNKVVRFMEDHPGVNVELGSHTDSRGSDSYNQKLSQNRAQSAVDYITSRGISSARISAKGYGESVLLNKCADGVPCSEQEQQVNRRTEFKVICPK